jgi:hypothetical protein
LPQAFAIREDAVVTSNDLKSNQAERLRRDVARMLRYLNRLVHRMSRLGFPIQDPMYVAATTARAAMQDLHTAAHYATCPTPLDPHR